MSITSRKVFKIYQSLDREQIRFVLDKKIKGHFTVSEWLGKLNRIAEMDKMGDEARDQARNLSSSFGFIFIITLILTILKPVLFFFPLGFLLLFVYFFVTYISLIKIDVVNHLRIFLVPMFRQLMEMVSKEEKINLTLDLFNPVSKENLLTSVENKIENKEKIYRHKWLIATVRLLTGENIDVVIEDTIHEKQSSLGEKTNKMRFREYEISHQMEMEIRASEKQFEPVSDDVRSEYGFLIVNKKSNSISKSLEEGMDPKIFFESLQDLQKKIKTRT